MNTHLLVTQLRFARRELQRCLAGVSEEDAIRRPLPMNCLSWIVGHLANQEQSYWVRLAQGRVLVPGLDELVGYGRPASTPPLAQMWAAWHTITQAADVYLGTLSPAVLGTTLLWEGKRPARENVGTMLMRNIHHYWFHIGEAHAVRQMLGHQQLPDFVGSMAGFEYPSTGE